MASPRAKGVIDNPPPDPSLDDLIKEHGTDDLDELIMRATVPQADIDKMRAAGPVRRDYPMMSSPELEQVRKLMAVATLPLRKFRTSSKSTVRAPSPLTKC